MTPVIQTFHLLALALAGWLNRQQQAVIDYLIHYHAERNYQGKDNVLLFPAATKAMKRVDGPICCKERLGGLLRYYHREAA